MKTILSSWTPDNIKRVGIFLVTVALIAGMVGCAPAQYNLTTNSTAGGSVTTPGEGTFTYDGGTVVNLVAAPEEGYHFGSWTGDVDNIANVNVASTTITMNDNYSITANFYNPEIRDWYDLDVIRDNLDGSYLLMNDLDSTTAGYIGLASPTANGGKGWQPIGDRVNPFTGTFDGQEYQIEDLFINRPTEGDVGLFAIVDEEGVIENVGMVNVDVTGEEGVGGLVVVNFGTVSNSYSSGNVTGNDFIGGLVGGNAGTVSNSYSTGSLTGEEGVGGLVGVNYLGTVSNSYSTGSLTGEGSVGGLVGVNFIGTVSNSYSRGNVTGNYSVGGLVGDNTLGSVSNSYSTGSLTGEDYVGGLVGYNFFGTVSNSYSTGSLTGEGKVGGLVGYNGGTVSNSYYNYDEVLINGENIITIGALFSEDFDQWLANDKFLDVNERLSQENGYYMVNNVTDFKELLAFGQDGSLKFRLKNDLDLATEPNFYIPYLSGEFDGNGHRISNLSFNFDFVAHVGLFGYLDYGGNVTQVGVENVNIVGSFATGGLAGDNRGTMSDSYSSGNVTGYVDVGGLMGYNSGDVTYSYSTSSVTGNYSVGGLVGYNSGDVTNSYSSGNVTGIEDVGGLVGYNKGTVSDSYATGSVIGEAGVGGLVGANLFGGTVSNSFWDTETSGQATSDGGTGKATEEMQDIATFLGATWQIIAVADPSTRNPSYIWNIVDDETYPFLGWEPVS